MLKRILVAVDDSPASLAAARRAVAVASELGAHLRAVHVVADDGIESRLAVASQRADVAQRRDQAGAAVLTRVEALARGEGVSVDTETLQGDVVREILAAARRWAADLLVVGRCRRRAGGEPYVGAHTRQVLEFAECPVLVVPAP